MKGKVAAFGAVVAVTAAAGHHVATSATTRGGATAAAAIAFAEQQAGKPYLWGGTGPDAFDCSGLVMMAYRAAGVSIARTSQEQWATEPHVTTLQPGDLVFYHGYLAPGEAPPGHVAIYVGGGKMAEAYGTGVPVRVTALRPGAWGYTDPAKAA